MVEALDKMCAHLTEHGHSGIDRAKLAQRIVAVVQEGEKGLDGIVAKVLNPGT